MLISCAGNKPFIFLANTKAASTSIHSCPEVVNQCEIRIRHSRFGKHLGLGRLVRRYAFIFDEVPLSCFTIVMIVREPIDWFMSWYRYRQTGKLRHHERTSFGMTPTAFWREKFSLENISQSRMLDLPETEGQQHLIRFGEHFSSDLARVARLLDWPENLKIPHANKSRPLASEEMDDALRVEILQHFRKDVALWERANRAGETP